MYISFIKPLFPTSLALGLLALTTSTFADGPVRPPTGYFMRSCNQADCKDNIDNKDVWDPNLHGYNTCQEVPGSWNGHDTKGVAVEAHNWCVNLYSEPNCQGIRVVAKSTWGACSDINVVGNTFGGAGSDLEFTVRSYVANAGDAVPVPGTQVVPVAMIPKGPTCPTCQTCPSCRSCCPHDGWGAKLRRS